MFKKIITVALVIMSLFALMIPMASAEVITVPMSTPSPCT